MYAAIFSIAAILPAAILMMVHWFPWHDAIGRRLSRLECYAIGVATINGTAIASLLLVSRSQPIWLAIAIIALCSISGGAGTLAAWTIDGSTQRRRTDRRIRQRQEIRQRYRLYAGIGQGQTPDGSRENSDATARR